MTRRSGRWTTTRARGCRQTQVALALSSMTVIANDQLLQLSYPVRSIIDVPAIAETTRSWASTATRANDGRPPLKSVHVIDLTEIFTCVLHSGNYSANGLYKRDKYRWITRRDGYVPGRLEMVKISNRAGSRWRITSLSNVASFKSIRRTEELRTEKIHEVGRPCRSRFPSRCPLVFCRLNLA